MIMMRLSALFVALAGTAKAGMDVDFGSRESIKAAAALKAQDVMSFYHGQEPGHTPGVLSGSGPDYHWWEAGALWGTMIDYWKYTSDNTYNEVVEASLLAQVGPDKNYMEPNVTAFMGNDDQAFWGLSAMLAAESNFQNPAPDDPQWLALAQAVFDTQTGSDRRDSSCGGGLRWQVFALNGGFDYKNSISNGLYFNLAARLARYTGDEFYAQRAAETFQWMLRVGLIDGNSFDVFDGAHVQHDCRDVNRAQFSYNVAVLLHGAAFMYEFTHSLVWAERVNGLLDSMLRTFFTPPIGGADADSRIAFEPTCEGGVSNVPAEGCTDDMLAFKSFDLRWMATAAQLCPWTRDRTAPVLRASAEAAVRQCTGGANRRMCGMHWASGIYDGSVGVGQEMNVLSALMVLLADEPTNSYGKVDDEYRETTPAGQLPHAPLTHDTGGTSEGGLDTQETVAGGEVELEPITAIDVTSAAILTSALIVSAFVVFVFMCSETDRPRKQKDAKTDGSPYRPEPEVTRVNASIDWPDLPERIPSRVATKARTVATSIQRPIQPAKSQTAAHRKKRAAIHREDGDSVFGGDEASDMDAVRTRMSRTRDGGEKLNRKGVRLQGQLDVAVRRGQQHGIQSLEPASLISTHVAAE